MDDFAPTPPPPKPPLLSRRGRLILGAEPIAVQVERYRRATLALTAVTVAIALMIAAIFAGFGAPVTGLVVVGVGFGPIVALAWLSQWRLLRFARGISVESRDRSETDDRRASPREPGTNGGLNDPSSIRPGA